MDSDSATLVFVNNTSAPAYLFDSYMRDKCGYGYGKMSYLDRYNEKTKEYKRSYLPFIQFLACVRTDFGYIGEDALLRRGQFLYSFTEISPNDSIQVKIPVDDLYSDIFYLDVDMMSYTVLDTDYYTKHKNSNKLKFKEPIDLIPVKNIESPDKVTLEFAIYHNIDYFREYLSVEYQFVIIT